MDPSLCPLATQPLLYWPLPLCNYGLLSLPRPLPTFWRIHHPPSHPMHSHLPVPSSWSCHSGFHIRPLWLPFYSYFFSFSSMVGSAPHDCLGKSQGTLCGTLSTHCVLSLSSSCGIHPLSHAGLIPKHCNLCIFRYFFGKHFKYFISGESLKRKQSVSFKYTVWCIQKVFPQYPPEKKIPKEIQYVCISFGVTFRNTLVNTKFVSEGYTKDYTWSVSFRVSQELHFVFPT